MAESNGDEIPVVDNSEQAAMDRLRDRTDELELIISSLTIFALYSIPGWAYNSYADSYLHLSTPLVIAGLFSTTLLTGFCYGLGSCFVVHLMARAYWVGLIGLRAAFPAGINWQRMPVLGPITRRHYQASLPNLDELIAGADRLASSLFAVISMLTLGTLWFGTIMLLVLVPAGALGGHFGLTNTALGLATLALLLLFLGIPLLVYLLDTQLAARFSRLSESRSYNRLVLALRRISGAAFPQRLILPVRLTLQSNTRPFVFVVLLVLFLVIIVVIGNLRVLGWRNFTLSREFTYLGAEAVQTGFSSSYYEDMRSPKDRLKAWPMISSFAQSGSSLRLFIPYQPLRDNLILDSLCENSRTAANPRNAAATAAARLDCLRALWSVTLGGNRIAMQDFIAAERADLSMRGLMGIVPLEGLQPGMHRLDIVWNPDPQQDLESLDDRYSGITRNWSIPFSFNPEFERNLQ